MNLNFSIGQQAAKKTVASMKKGIQRKARINENFLSPSKIISSVMISTFSQKYEAKWKVFLSWAVDFMSDFYDLPLVYSMRR